MRLSCCTCRPNATTHMPSKIFGGNTCPKFRCPTCTLPHGMRPPGRSARDEKRRFFSRARRRLFAAGPSLSHPSENDPLALLFRDGDDQRHAWYRFVEHRLHMVGFVTPSSLTLPVDLMGHARVGALALVDRESLLAKSVDPIGPTMPAAYPEPARFPDGQYPRFLEGHQVRPSALQARRPHPTPPRLPPRTATVPKQLRRHAWHPPNRRALAPRPDRLQVPWTAPGRAPRLGLA